MIMLCEFRKKFRNVRYWVGAVSTMIVFEHFFFYIGILTSLFGSSSFPLSQRQSPTIAGP